MIQLIYGNLRIVLPSPQLNNTLVSRIGVKVKFAMDGAIWSYCQRPFPDRMTMSFLITNSEKRIELENFMKASMGQVITLRDHNDRVWTVKTTTTPLTVVDQGRSASTFTLEFEGALMGS